MKECILAVRMPQWPHSSIGCDESGPPLCDVRRAPWHVAVARLKKRYCTHTIYTRYLSSTRCRQEPEPISSRAGAVTVRDSSVEPPHLPPDERWSTSRALRLASGRWRSALAA